MKIKNYYKILGIDGTASSIVIKKAYYHLARKYHPDWHPNNPEVVRRFAEINEAYDILGDLDNRLRYSMLLSYSKKHKEDLEILDLLQKEDL